MEATKQKIVLIDPFADLPEEDGRDTAKARFLPFDQEIRAEKGRTLLESARFEGVKLPHACGGRARCATCRVRVVEGAGNLSEMDIVERKVLQQYKIQVAGMRLGCRAKVLGDCTVKVELTPEQALESWEKTGSAGWRPKGGWK